MMNKENNENLHDDPEGDKEETRFSWPRFIIGLMILLTPVWYIAYLSWQSDVVDQDHQVPIICTVTGAEQYTSTGAGKAYSSSQKYIAFDTEECRTILLPISSDDDGQGMADGVQVGRKYEFMMGRSQVGVKSGARDVFSYRGPVD